MAAQEFVITLIGNDTVGKTSIVNRLKYGTYQPHYIYTQGADKVKIPNFRVGSDFVDLLIFDTGGHHIQRQIIHKFIDAADAIMIIYDVTNERSFKKIPEWIRMARRTPLTDANENPEETYLRHGCEDDDPLLMLVGNKTDLTSTELHYSNQYEEVKTKERGKRVKQHKLEKMAKCNRISLYNEVSAKADINVDLTFQLLVDKLIKKNGLTGKLSEPTRQSRRYRFCTLL